MSLILVDGGALIYRAYYAFAHRPLTAPDGEQTSVAFGFVNSVLRLIDARRPTHLAVVFDRREPTFRHRRYEAYKATRKPMPEELAAQLPRLRELLQAWGVGVCELAGWEADDVIATLARRSAGVCERALLYSGDKDFLQILDARTSLLKPGRRGDDVTEVTADAVRREFGLEPARLVDVFALWGDASDNIPGAPGIGAKTARQLIRSFGSLEALYARLDEPELTPRLRRILEENREQVWLSRELFRIDVEAPVQVDWEALRSCLPDGAAARELMAKLGLRQLLALTDRLARAGMATAARRTPERPRPAASPDEAAEPRPPVAAAGREGEREAQLSFVIVTNDSDLRAYIHSLPEGAAVAVATEDDGERPDRARLLGLALCAVGGRPAYIPVLESGNPRAQAPPQTAGPGTLFGPDAPPTPARCHLAWIQPWLAPMLRDASRAKLGHDLKRDAWLLARHGLPLDGPFFDVMVAAYLLDPDRARRDLVELARDYLAPPRPPAAADASSGDRRGDALAEPLSRRAGQTAAAAATIARLAGELAGAVDEAGLSTLLHEVELPLLNVLWRMERRGIRLDTAFLAGLKAQFAREMGELAQRIEVAAGEPFNVQSPQQLSRILFERLGLKPPKKTATGLSTDSGVLGALASQHALPGLVLEHRQLAKLQSAYAEALPELVNQETQLIHTSFNQTIAATGRLSSSDPNLQNIPIRTEAGRLIRRAFVPREAGRVFIAADYSQIELRLLAHLSGDAALTKAFREGGDVHRRTAALIAGVAEEQVTSDMRRRAKAINFGVIYGMGARALARQTGVSVREATAFIENYFATYPGVKAWLEETRARARREGKVETMLGRRRLLPGITSPNDRLRSLAERMAVNTPIQGSAADLIKVAMIRLDRELAQGGLRSLLLLQVHDELLLESPRDEAAEVAALTRDCMESVRELSVPLVVEVRQGGDWEAAHG